MTEVDDVTGSRDRHTEHADAAAVRAALRRHVSAASVVAEELDHAPGTWHETGRRPLARVECAVDADIAVVVRVAAEHGLPVAVWGGRRDVYGRNAGDGGVVIDLRRRREVVLAPEGRTV